MIFTSYFQVSSFSTSAVATPDPRILSAGNPLLEDILVFTVASAVSSILPPGWNG
jgi:hypothetical protein